MQTDQKIHNIFENAISFAITLRKPGASRRVKQEQIGKKEEDKAIQTETDAEELRVSKYILESPEFSAIRSIDSAIYNFVRGLSLPSPLKRGIYLIPLNLTEKLTKGLDELLVNRQDAINVFVLAYPAIHEGKKTSLGALYDESEFPTIEQLKDSFKVIKQFFDMVGPSKLKSVSEKLFARAQQEVQSNVQSSILDIQTALRTGFKDLIDNAAEMLTIGPQGKKRKFHGVEKLIEFMEVFDAKNILGDSDLKSLVEQAKEILAGHTNEDIKQLAKGDRFRQSMQQKFSNLSNLLKPLVQDVKREINL